MGLLSNHVYQKICFNCLHSSHLIDKFRSKWKCFICKRKHYTIHCAHQNEKCFSLMSTMDGWRKYKIVIDEGWLYNVLTSSSRTWIRFFINSCSCSKGKFKILQAMSWYFRQCFTSQIHIKTEKLWINI